MFLMSSTVNIIFEDRVEAEIVTALARVASTFNAMLPCRDGGTLVLGWEEGNTAVFVGCEGGGAGAEDEAELILRPSTTNEGGGFFLGGFVSAALFDFDFFLFFSFFSLDLISFSISSFWISNAGHFSFTSSIIFFMKPCAH
jgi:hypothetical protein